MWSSPEGTVGNASDKLWQRMRTLTVRPTGLEKELFRSVECSFCLWVNALCRAWMFVYLSTCQALSYCKVRMTLCQMQREQKPLSHTVGDWYPVVLFVLLESLRRWLFSATLRRMLRTSLSTHLRLFCLLWSFYCGTSSSDLWFNLSWH